MTYRRDSFAGLSDFGPYALREFEKLELELDVLRQQLETVTRLAEINGVVLLYQYSGNLDTSTDPGAGNVSFNTTQVGNATEMAVSEVDAYGRLVLGSGALRIGDLITVAASDLSGSQVFAVSADVTREPTFVRVPLSLQGGTMWNPAPGDYARVSWRPIEIVR